MRSVILIIAVVAVAGCTRQPVDVVPAGESFMPLAVGNRWVFEEQIPDGDSSPERTPRRDTISITARRLLNRIEFFRLEANWPGFEDGGPWVYRGENGNLFVSPRPQFGGSAFLLFDAEVGQRWPLSGQLHGCLTSLALLDDYAVITTPVGRFDGAKEIGGGWIDCTDFGWTADFARGVGPVRWEAITIAGPTNWLLIEADIHDNQSAAAAGD